MSSDSRHLLSIYFLNPPDNKSRLPHSSQSGLSDLVSCGASGGSWQVLSIWWWGKPGDGRMPREASINPTAMIRFSRHDRFCDGSLGNWTFDISSHHSLKLKLMGGSPLQIWEDYFKMIELLYKYFLVIMKISESFKLFFQTWKKY